MDSIITIPPTTIPQNEIIDNLITNSPSYSERTDWNALATFISVVGSVLISVCLTIHKSKCDRIKCGPIDIHRNVVDKEEVVEDEIELNNNV